MQPPYGVMSDLSLNTFRNGAEPLLSLTFPDTSFHIAVGSSLIILITAASRIA
jgi:hypothetical protein